MKILIHSNAPWVGTGYGRQTRLLIPRLLADGHEVIVSAITGLHGGEIEWAGRDAGDADQPVRVLPAGQYAFGVDTLPAYIADEKPDLVLTIMDCRMLGSIAGVLQGAPLACWVPSDTTPLSAPERAFLEASRAVPIAMTRYGAQLLHDAGWHDVAYIPHAVDTVAYSNVHDDPAQPGLEERRRLGIPEDAFVVGMVAANTDAVRKAFPEQFEAFRRFRASNAKAHLCVHTVANSASGWNLEELALEMGIVGDVSFSQPLPQLTGRIDDAHMATLYRAFDVLSLCSYGEGFGVPLIEALSCGTPVVTTDAGAMREILTGGGGHAAGFLVSSQPFWNPVHKAWWARPDIDAITSGYRYYAGVKGKPTWWSAQQRARARGAAYDVDVVYSEAWRPFLAEWAERRPLLGGRRAVPAPAAAPVDLVDALGPALAFDEQRIAELRAAGLSEESAVAMAAEE